MISCAFKIHRASGPGRGTPVQISILAYSLGHNSLFMKISFFSKSSQCSSELVAIAPISCAWWQKAL